MSRSNGCRCLSPAPMLIAATIHAGKIAPKMAIEMRQATSGSQTNVEPLGAMAVITPMRLAPVTNAAIEPAPASKLSSNRA